MSNVITSLNLVNGKVKFEGIARENEPLTMDYFPPIGDGDGYTGLELLTISLAGCSATSIVGLLRKMNKEIIDFTVEVNGDRQETHPTVLTCIHIKFRLTSPDTSPDELQKAITLSEEKYCPVWAMLKPGCQILVEQEIINPVEVS